MTQNFDVSELHIYPGTLVTYDGMQDGPEYGVVIHCWFDREIEAHDCYVAFFGNERPNGMPLEKPYVLRYAVSSLKIVDPKVDHSGGN